MLRSHRLDGGQRPPGLIIAAGIGQQRHHAVACAGMHTRGQRARVRLAPRVVEFGLDGGGFHLAHRQGYILRLLCLLSLLAVLSRVCVGMRAVAGCILGVVRRRILRHTLPPF